jgi:REP-associated tyrosine transposase
MPQSLASLHYHIVFSTKNRVPAIRPEWQDRLHEYIGGILRAHGAALLCAGGMPDHLHLHVTLSKTMCVAEALRLIKANSSGWIHNTFANARAFEWQAGYGAFTVSRSQAQPLDDYIRAQAEHHKKQTFDEELLALLRLHEIEYDRGYLFD